TNWSSPSNAVSVGTPNINWVVVKACPRRDEYIAVTLDTTRAVKAQVFTNGSWGNLKTITNVPNARFRGVDIAYETLSGDAMVVAANPTTVTWSIWNGAAWTGPSNLSISTNVLWVKLASDPVSDEIIVMVQNARSNYTAQVWNGDAWGSNKLPAALSSGTNYECMAVEYETSGSQAIIVSGNGATANTTAGSKWSSWNGLVWSSERTNTIGDHLEQGFLVNDPNSDKLLLTYIDHDVNIGKLFWNGSNWTTSYTLSAGYAIADRCFQGQFETISTNAGHAIIPYSNNNRARFQHATDPSGATWSTAVNVDTVAKATVQTRRTGDGKILAVFFDNGNSRYDFSWHNGIAWSAMLTLENEPSVLATPFKEPFMMAPQLWVLP
ncbi:MAG: hypothetical protein NT011_08455, partial [Kiritimatiellaeota bacterium]|nr:hypothetical protein [Kiritimatiellota bacterium]